MNLLFACLIAFAHADTIADQIEELSTVLQFQAAPAILEDLDDIGGISSVLRAQFAGVEPTACALERAFADPTRFGVDPVQVETLNQWLKAVVDATTIVNALAIADHHGRTENQIFQIDSLNSVYPEWRDRNLITSAVDVIMDPSSAHQDLYRALHRTFLVNLDSIQRWEKGALPRLTSDASRVQWLAPRAVSTATGEGCPP